MPLGSVGNYNLRKSFENGSLPSGNKTCSAGKFVRNGKGEGLKAYTY